MKINIVRQDALKFKRIQRIRRINLFVTVGSLVLFGLSVLWVTGQFVYLNVRTSSLTSKIKTLDSLYNSRGKDVAEYLSVKQIITTVDQIQSKRFKYKDFLNGIYKLLPPTSKLSSVDFGKTGVVVFSVRLASLNEYDTLINNVNNNATDKAFLFSDVSQKTLQRDQNGQYLVTLELKIK